jgi:hypothetical protein
MKNLTVDKAIWKGHQMVNFPIFIIILVGGGLVIYLSVLFDKGIVFLFGIIGILGASCLWWGFMITKWRIWAFGNCRNVHDLKRRAINEQLIWFDGSFFEKMEIRSAKQKRKLKLLERKFEMEDVPEKVEDDGTIPPETKIYYSKIVLAFYRFFGIITFLYGFYLVIEGGVFGYFLVIISFFAINSNNKKASSKEAYIILNSNGIKTIKTPFMKWKNVKRIETRLRGVGKNSKWYLYMEFKINNKKRWSADMEIGDLDVSKKELEKLIKIYQQRNRMQLRVGRN